MKKTKLTKSTKLPITTQTVRPLDPTLTPAVVGGMMRSPQETKGKTCTCGPCVPD